MGDDRSGSEELLSRRLALRRPTPADVETIYRIHSDPVACAHNPTDMLDSLADAEERYRHWDNHWQEHQFGYWVIYRRTADAPHDSLGFCGLKLTSLAGREALNLFYRLDPAAWGDGVATEAATTVVRWATRRLWGFPIIARIRPANVASATVAVRAGLHRAPHLDTVGEDGLDWIFTKGWPDEPSSPSHRW